MLTQRGDDSRVGWNGGETTLNTADVNAADFGRRVAYPVDGKIYAQPLFVPGLRVAGGVHDTVIVATENDSLYAFDADASGAAGASGSSAASAPAPLWHVSFLVNGAVPVPSTPDVACPSISPQFGITGTPVIDPATDRLYVVATMKTGTTIVDYLHAIDVHTGRDALPPTLISASVRGTGDGEVKGVLTFDARHEQQHLGLLLDHGVVYVGFASYCSRPPYQGWVLGYRADDLGRVTVYNSAPDGTDGGIWQSATAPVADASGDIYLVTGNGDFNLAGGGRNASDSVLRLRPEKGTLTVVDYFTPYYQSCLAAHDQDFGSGAPLMLPGGEILAVGKEGAVDVLDSSDLGGYHTIADPCADMNRTDVDHALQVLPPGTVNGGVWGAETTWAGPSGRYVYTAGQADRLSAWRLADGRLVAPPASRAPETLTYPGGIPVGSSDGSDPSTAIVWILDQENGPALRAYRADNLADELYSTTQKPGRDAVPGYDNFCLPTVADGRVFVGSTGELLVYGLLK